MSSIPEYITRLSNEKLEQDIAWFYYTAQAAVPGRRVKEEGQLALLWQEFDTRVAEGVVDVD